MIIADYIDTVKTLQTDRSLLFPLLQLNIKFS